MIRKTEQVIKLRDAGRGGLVFPKEMGVSDVAGGGLSRHWGSEGEEVQEHLGPTVYVSRESPQTKKYRFRHSGRHTGKWRVLKDMGWGIYRVCYIDLFLFLSR